MNGAEEYDDGRGVARRAARDSMFLATSISADDGSILAAAKVRNLSATGMMADCEAHFTKGQRIIADLRGVGDVTGYIAWVDGKRIGVAFDHQIDPQMTRRPVGVKKPMLMTSISQSPPTYASTYIPPSRVFKTR